jgi:hypothetical protein
MNISSDLTSSPYGFEDLVSKARPRQAEGLPQDAFTSIAEEEEKKRQQAHPGGGAFPGQMSEEDRAKVEMLKSRAEQIAAQAENGLSSGQEAEIKDIQKQIGDITKMPMNENLVEKAKDQAEAKKAEAQANADQDDPSRNGQDGNMPGDQNRLDMAGQPGNQMLRQNAFITSVKTAGASLGASSGLKGRA